MYDYIDLRDRMEFTNKDGTFVEEILAVKCPECGRTTERVVTGKLVTWYIHGELYCKVQRGQEFIPDALMYAKAKNVELHDLVISCTVRCW